LNSLLKLVTATALGATVLFVVPAGARAADLAQGKQNYDAVCAACHGKTGNADGPGAAALQVPPKRFDDCAAMSKVTDDTMISVIKDGGAAHHLSSEMQPWGSAFDDDQVMDLVAYIRSFCKK
jgi:mono/diheme cytochrome c family protein